VALPSLKCQTGLKRERPLKKSTKLRSLGARSLSAKLDPNRVAPVVEAVVGVVVEAVVEGDGRVVDVVAVASPPPRTPDEWLSEIELAYKDAGCGCRLRINDIFGANTRQFGLM
jgi:hypothetical protein